MRVLIIDGQGGKLGKLIVETIKSSLPEIELVAVGTNSIATATMLKAGADFGATGENPVVVNAAEADCIVGPLGILAADALFGEVTEKMAAAVGRAKAMKLLVPVNRCNNYVVGTKNPSMSEYAEEVAKKVQELYEKNKH